MNSRCEITVEIGGMPILLHMRDDAFRRLLARRYAGFVGSPVRPRFEFEVELTAPSLNHPDDDVQVRMTDGVWRLRRGDFRARWDPRAGCGRIRQSANPYAIDSVLRIVHTLILAREGGFLLHSAGAIRNRRAFLFSGVSGAGKTTISRLAPPDVTLLTDEVSYIRRDSDGYHACGTPFAGELARVGENCSAPIESLFFLHQGQENKIESIAKAEAIRCLMLNILFFAEDADLVSKVFQSACDFVERVPVRRLTFLPRFAGLGHDPVSKTMTETYIARSPAIASRMLGGEMMVMSAVDSTFFTLNPVATVIWQAADGQTPLSEIVARHVCTEFEIDSETALRDAEHFVTELSSHGILLLSDRPFPNSSAAPTEAA